LAKRLSAAERDTAPCHQLRRRNRPRENRLQLPANTAKFREWLKVNAA
jgi:hypothetical protein